MQAADQPGFIGIKPDRNQIDLEVFGFENDIGTRNREFADPALPETAADHDAFRAGPGLGLEKSPRHISEFLREFLDRAVHQRGSGDIVARQRLVEFALGDFTSGLVAERIVAVLLQRLAQRVQNLAERTLAGAVAEKAVIVLQLGIVAVDVYRRQAARTVLGDTRWG